MNRRIRELVWLLVVASATGGDWKPPALAADAASPAEPVAAVAAETNTLTLERAVRLALAHNPELRAAASRVEATAGRAYQAWLWPNPELELAIEDGPTSGGVITDAKQTVGVAQTLPFPGKKKLDHAIGTAAIRATGAELDLRRRDLVRDVKIAFFQVLAAQELVTVAGQLVRVAEAAAQTARKRVEAGAAADQEQLRSEIALEQARVERAGFERELAIARQSLATLLGRPDLKDVPVSGALAKTVDVALFEQRPERWLISHPSVVAARAAREQADLELRRARLEPYPDVKLGVAGGREGAPDRDSIVEFRVSLPLPIIDRSRGRKQEGRANLAIAEAEAVAIEQRLLQAWGTASSRLRTAAEQVANYRERLLPKANQALRLVQVGFEEGKFGLIDLLDTQRTAAEARLAYQQKLLELNIAQAELEALLDLPAATAGAWAGATPAPGRPPFSPEPR